MARHSRNLSVRRIQKNRMAAPFAMKDTAMRLKVPNQVNSFHIYTSSGSLMTSEPAISF